MYKYDKREKYEKYLLLHFIFCYLLYVYKIRGMNMRNVKVAIVGVTGYVGGELLKILHTHPNVEIKCFTSVSYVGKKFHEVYPNSTFVGKDIDNIVFEDGGDLNKISKEVDVIFLSLPHGIASNQVNDNVLKNSKVIDMGADFRLKNKDVYEKWYKVGHGNSSLLNDAVYGLCEVNREKIKNALLVANPGCYATCSILSLYPLVKEGIIKVDDIIIDAKSGVSGAGKSLVQENLFCECNENIKAYKIAAHRHIPEIEQELSLKVPITFTPHLVPMNRGILATIYTKLTKNLKHEDIKSVYHNYYKNECFVRILDEEIFPETRWLKNSNFINIGFKIDERTNNLIIVGAIDNLMKGAAGQAIQNMNIMFGFDEKTSLANINLSPI
jgi:N-acetyl-gamma-glutamyl-phosphate reductase